MPQPAQPVTKREVAQERAASAALMERILHRLDAVEPNRGNVGALRDARRHLEAAARELGLEVLPDS